MSVYDGHIHLDETIDSILEQTFTDFEFIIIDDGSTDGAINIIRKYKERDPRIILNQNQTNIGLAASLNKGIRMAKGKYIARMDADDVCLPERFERQVEYLEKTPDVWILGTNIFHIDDEGNTIREIAYPTKPNELRWNMLFGAAGVVCHPCAMMVTEKIRESGLYKLTKTSQDLELWSRYILYEPLPLSNLQIPLVKCRWHEKSFSVKHAKLQNHVSNQIRLDTLNHSFNRVYGLEMVEAFRTLTPQDCSFSKQEVKKYISEWFQIWKEFQVRFDLCAAEMKPKYEQLFFRIKNLVVTNPLGKRKNGKVWLLELVPIIGWEACAKVFCYKLKLRFSKAKN